MERPLPSGFQFTMIRHLLFNVNTFFSAHLDITNLYHLKRNNIMGLIMHVHHVLHDDNHLATSLLPDKKTFPINNLQMEGKGLSISLATLNTYSFTFCLFCLHGNFLFPLVLFQFSTCLDESVSVASAPFPLYLLLPCITIWFKK